MPICTVCGHPSREEIDKALLVPESIRDIAGRFGLARASVHRHKLSHLSKKLQRAVARRQEKVEDVFLDRHEHLFRESLQYLDDAKGAVKTLKKSVVRKVITTDKDGGVTEREEAGTEYELVRDIGAMAAPLTVATNLNRLLGEATGRFSKESQPERPREPFVVILAQGQHARPGPSSAPELGEEEPLTIDVSVQG
jgi:hypothetical protein